MTLHLLTEFFQGCGPSCKLCPISNACTWSDNLYWGEEQDPLHAISGQHRGGHEEELETHPCRAWTGGGERDRGGRLHHSLLHLLQPQADHLIQPLAASISTGTYQIQQRKLDHTHVTFTGETLLIKYNYFQNHGSDLPSSSLLSVRIFPGCPATPDN